MIRTFFQAQDSYLLSESDKYATVRKTLHGDGHNPNAFGTPGIEKSSISSFRMIPVSGSITWEPNSRLTVDVTDTAMPLESTIDVWLCIA